MTLRHVCPGASLANQVDRAEVDAVFSADNLRRPFVGANRAHLILGQPRRRVVRSPFGRGATPHANTSPQFPDPRRRDAVLAGDEQASPRVAADGLLLGDGQLRFAVRVAGWVSISPLGVHIRRIVGGRSEEQVRRIAAWRIVAVMADEQTVGNGPPVGNDPRKAVSALLTKNARLESAIAEWVYANHARPAFGRPPAPNSRPQPRRGRNAIRHSQRHACGFAHTNNLAV